MVYTATADTRPDDAFADLVAAWSGRQRGVDVVLPVAPPGRARPAPMIEAVERACALGDTSVFVSGIDPGWALDILPILVSGVSAGIEEIRIQEIFNYALYDAPDVVREVIGFGGPDGQTPLMLLDIALEMVWAPMVRILADVARGRARGRAHPGRAPAAGAHDRGARAWAPSRRARRARSGSRCRASSTGDRAARRRARHPHRRRLRAGLAHVDRSPAASTASG